MPRNSRLLRILFALAVPALMLVVLFGLSGPGVSQAAQAVGAAGTGAPVHRAEESQPELQEPDFDRYDVVVVRAFFADRAMVNDLAAWKEPWELHFDKGYLVVGVTREEYDRLLAAGFRLEVDEQRTAEINRLHLPLPNQGGGIPGFPCYRTVEETFDTAEQIVADYPTLATWIDVGDSWEKTQDPSMGYDMMVLRLTNSEIPGPKPALWVMSAIHAREYTTAELNTRFAEYLVQNYGVDPDVTWMLDHQEVHLMLQANPDGRKHAEDGLLWRKNTNNNYCSDTNSRGADLNRNYSFMWDCCGGSSDQECSEIYHGAGPASEPETQAVIDYVSSIIPDQREDPITATAPLTTTGSFLDLHSSGGFVLWPWGFTADPAPNGTQLQTLGRRYAYFNDYHPEQSSTGLYFTDGTTKDWAYGELGIPGYTIELGTEFFEQCNVFEGIILPDNLPMLLYAAQTARTPYLLSSGPEALDVELSDTTIAPGEPVTVMAEINDTRFNNSNGTEPTQPIAEAGYYIDVPPWSEEPAPVAYPMEPADGTFDSPVEDATAEIDTTELAVGRHMIYVRGRDTSDTWGAVGAAFLFVIDPEVSPTIQGYVREAGSGAPLAATVSANGLFQTTTDPATGYYQMQVISDTYDLTATAPDHAAQTVQDVVAHDFQTVEQDFSLAPICAAFADDVEAGNSGWTAEAPWAITEETAHSPTHSWTDSPGSLYANNVNVALTSPLLDLTDYEATTLTFWQICDTEAGYDYCHVELSADGGATWSEVALYDGAQSAWEEVSLAVPVLDGQPDARVRFRLSSDFTITGDGWHVDDIRLLGTGAGCVPPPTAVTVEMLAAASNGGRGLLIALGTLGLCALAGARVTRRRRARRV